jgi:hypothetical protein
MTKEPLLKHVWAIRTKLQLEGRTRDLAMFNVAIDSKLRGCDVVKLKVEDVAPHGQALDRATVRQAAHSIMRTRREHCAALPWLSGNPAICYRPRRSGVHLGNVG